jgi:hypothetical protein
MNKRIFSAPNAEKPSSIALEHEQGKNIILPSPLKQSLQVPTLLI